MNSRFQPAYLELFHSGDLQLRAEVAVRKLRSCRLCPHSCEVDRPSGDLGVCATGRHAIISSYGPHHGEEPPLVGRRGSGTIFFGHCNLNCTFCQNWQISQGGEGRTIQAEELARIMVGLQDYGCHNINLVSPSHVIAQILEALVIAVSDGLRLPLVYNTGGYDSPVTLELLEGVVDIYMPDMKFGHSGTAQPFLGVDDYAEICFAAVRKMHQQVGDLILTDGGIAMRGLIVRHLVLPDNLAGTERVCHFLAKEVSPETYLNLMDQYRPCHKAGRHSPLDRRPSRAEIRQARDWAYQAGLTNLA